MNWVKLPLNVQNVEVTTEKAVLIVVPKAVCARLGVSEKHMFWAPLKLIRDAGGKGWFKTLSLTEDFEIKLFKKGSQGKIINEATINGQSLIAAWEA
jgi:hypothetical protein